MSVTDPVEPVVLTSRPRGTEELLGRVAPFLAKRGRSRRSRTCRAKAGLADPANCLAPPWSGCRFSVSNAAPESKRQSRMLRFVFQRYQIRDVDGLSPNGNRRGQKLGVFVGRSSEYAQNFSKPF